MPKVVGLDASSSPVPDLKGGDSVHVGVHTRTVAGGNFDSTTTISRGKSSYSTGTNRTSARRVRRCVPTLCTHSAESVL